jgi:predicted dehydrogenase
MTRSTRRSFLQSSLSAGLAFTLPRATVAAPSSRPIGPNDEIRVAMIGMGGIGGAGVGGRGRQLIQSLQQVSDAKIVALCDVDQNLLDHEIHQLGDRYGRTKAYKDMREVFDDQDIDAVFVATPNHWHALATVWACQAGKDVYVEKPASFSIWEGRQMVAAARKYKRMVQVGTQARSSSSTAQSFEFVRSGQLGRILYARAIIYRPRKSIGKVPGPQPIPASVDYDLWLGPAPKTSLMRRAFHYDWHWDWSTGNGEIGNNGVHQLDRCRWALGQQGLPRRAISVGGRFTFDDDGQTPNTQIAFLDCDPAPIICEVRGLPAGKGSKTMDKYRGVGKGLVIQCEGGSLVSGRGSVVYDNSGKKIKDFSTGGRRGRRGSPHQENFFAAMRSRNADELNAEILDGHLSAALCHMANVSYRLGSKVEPDALFEVNRGVSEWSDSLDRLQHHLLANGVDLEETPAVLGPWAEIDSKSELFVGEFAEQANALSRREYRKPFVVPEIA